MEDDAAVATMMMMMMVASSGDGKLVLGGCRSWCGGGWCCRCPVSAGGAVLLSCLAALWTFSQALSCLVQWVNLGCLLLVLFHVARALGGEGTQTLWHRLMVVSSLF